jgi:hypothetical protein
MSFVHTARRAAALLAIVAAAACSDSTAPTIDNIDASSAAARVEPVLAVMDQQPIASFGALAGIGGLPASASVSTFGAVAQLTKATARGPLDRSAPLLARSVARAADVIPVEARGQLFTYNETTGQYEGAASTDAPENGIRIVLYAVDPLTWQISSPATPVGRVDLLDESTTQQNRLHVEVRTQAGVELMDYAITHTVTASSESFSIAGSATNGTTAVNFDLSGTASQTAATATFDLTAPSLGFSVAQNVNVNMLTEQATIGVTLGYDGHTLSFSVSFDADGDMSGEIRYDNLRYATFSFTYDETTGEATSVFTKANGRPLTVEELEAISSLFERALDFDNFWAGLLWPVGALAPAI